MARKVGVFGALLLVLAVGLAQADYLTEIQVYDDSINKPGEWGLEMHMNSTLSGNSAPDYRGGVANVHTFRTTAEISYGFTSTLEGGLYLPFFKEATGNLGWAGPAFRLKWIPHPAPEEGGLFWGVNGEYDISNTRWLSDRYQMVFFPIVGYRDNNWLLATNLVLQNSLPQGYRLGDGDFEPSFKITRRIAESIASGFELYSDYGSLKQWASQPRQTNQLFWVLDVDKEPWVFNLGIGRGLNDATDRWAVKAIIEIPLH
jgi:hypothetical protein